MLFHLPGQEPQLGEKNLLLKKENMRNHQLTEDIHQSTIKKFEKQKA